MQSIICVKGLQQELPGVSLLLVVHRSGLREPADIRVHGHHLEEA